MQLELRRWCATVMVFSIVGLISAAALAEAPRIIAGPMFTQSESGTVDCWFQSDRAFELRAVCRPITMPGGDRIQYRTSDARFAARQDGRLRPLGRNAYVVTFQGEPRTLLNIWLERPTFTANENAPDDAIPEMSWHIWTPPEPASQQSRTPVDAPHVPDTHIDASLDPPTWIKRPGTYRIAFGSCSHQEKFPKTQPIWSAIAKDKPDCFLFIGDNIYLPNRSASYPTSRDKVLKLYCDTYDRQRQMPEMQPLLRSTYSFGLWDDHDYGPNNSDRTWKWKDVALEAFMLYFPGEYGLPDVPGCFRKISLGDVDVFMLDDRTYRDPNKAADRKTFLGERQLAWLKEGLTDSSAKFKLIVCGNQILSDTHPHESWGTYFREERDVFLRWLWDARIEGVVFLAGDRHFAELVRKPDPQGKGPDLWELTSSPLANDAYNDGDKILNSERVSSYTAGPNYGLLDFNTSAEPPNVRLSIKDELGKTVFHKTIRAK